MNGSFNFEGKVALVTGASSGIGRAAALMFAQNGAKVVIADVDLSGEETADAIKRGKHEAIFVRTDVSDAEQVERLVTAAVDTYGGLNCAFNNAGVLGEMSMLADTDAAAFDRTFDVDVKGVFL